MTVSHFNSRVKNPPPSPETLGRLLLSEVSGAAEPSLPRIRNLLKAGALSGVFDANGLNAVMHCIIHGHDDAARILLHAGANVHAREKNGYTLLMMACAWNRPAVAEMLLDRGADPDETSLRGATAIGIARKKGYGDIINLLEREAIRRRRDLKNGMPTHHPVTVEPRIRITGRKGQK